MTEAMINVEFNGENTQIPAGTTVAEMLVRAEIRTHLVAVEVNLDVVPRDQHANFSLNDGDRLEVVTLVGGG